MPTVVHSEECSKKVFLAAKIYPLQINTSQDGTGECCLHSDPKHCTYIYSHPPSSTDTPSNYKSLTEFLRADQSKPRLTARDAGLSCTTAMHKGLAETDCRCIGTGEQIS